ncbi:MAG TPA: nuclear transport factor 2 family protein [Stellaceae bacterium]|nr:nuclear transport factor 2 family protein [Stellaceae bacterium]
MGGSIASEPARSPQDLERLLVSREWAGDVEGMVALYERDAVVDCGDGRVLRGRDAIRAYFAQAVAEGRKFQVGVQQPAMMSGDLALTSTRLPDGTVTAEVARRQSDGRWLWVVDRFCVTRTSW